MDRLIAKQTRCSRNKLKIIHNLWILVTIASCDLYRHHTYTHRLTYHVRMMTPSLFVCFCWTRYTRRCWGIRTCPCKFMFLDCKVFWLFIYMYALFACVVFNCIVIVPLVCNNSIYFSRTNRSVSCLLRRTREYLRTKCDFCLRAPFRRRRRQSTLMNNTRRASAWVCNYWPRKLSASCVLHPSYK